MIQQINVNNVLSQIQLFCLIPTIKFKQKFKIDILVHN
jgi:hypothetical protein